VIRQISNFFSHSNFFIPGYGKLKCTTMMYHFGFKQVAVLALKLKKGILTGLAAWGRAAHQKKVFF